MNILLQIAPHLPIDGKLKDILKATPGACLTYAVIEGNRCSLTCILTLKT